MSKQSQLQVIPVLEDFGTSVWMRVSAQPPNRAVVRINMTLVINSGPIERAESKLR